MAVTVNISTLKNKFSEYLHRVREGEEFTITDRNEPIARIVPVEQPLIRVDMKQWLKDHPPIKTTKRQTSSAELLRQIRDEE